MGSISLTDILRFSVKLSGSFYLFIFENYGIGYFKAVAKSGLVLISNTISVPEAQPIIISFEISV